jgi:hypothetical protein
MTKQTQPIDLPSYELVQKLMYESGFMISDPGDEMEIPAARFMKLASRLIQHGADQELKACCEWVSTYLPYLGDFPMPEDKLRAARRPKPPSLKESALRRLDYVTGFYDDKDIIRRALEALPND